MDAPKRITRLEFVQAIARSRAVRFTLFIIGGAVLAFIATGLWQHRGVVALVAGLGVIVGVFALSGLLATIMWAFWRSEALLKR
jgi:TRAP-type uncharacterized transport system fused permease subunit